MAQAQQVATVASQQPSLIRTLASKYDMDPTKFAVTVKKTCIAGDCSDEDFAAFLMVAKEYDLNPIIKEIFAFPKRGGGIQPIVSVDGWISMINRQPSFNGMEFEDKCDDKGQLLSITCRMFRKDRDRPIEVTEYMSECRRPTDTWKQWPARMLRHKSAIQCARYAFGFSGIMEPDEFERSEMAVDITPHRDAPPAPTRTAVGQTSIAHSEIRAIDATALEGALKSSPSAAELSATWAVAMRDGDLDAIKSVAPDVHAHLCETYNALHEAFSQASAVHAGGTQTTEPEEAPEAPADTGNEEAISDAEQTTRACVKAPGHFKTAAQVTAWFDGDFQATARESHLSKDQIARVKSAVDARLAALTK